MSLLSWSVFRWLTILPTAAVLGRYNNNWLNGNYRYCGFCSSCGWIHRLHGHKILMSASHNNNDATEWTPATTNNRRRRKGHQRVSQPLYPPPSGNNNRAQRRQLLRPSEYGEQQPSRQVGDDGTPVFHGEKDNDAPIKDKSSNNNSNNNSNNAPSPPVLSSTISSPTRHNNLPAAGSHVAVENLLSALHMEDRRSLTNAVDAAIPSRAIIPSASLCNDDNAPSQKQQNNKEAVEPPLEEQELNHNSQRKDEPYILMLVGYPGSGKSTLAERLCRSQPWKFVRVNQDQLKSRHKCIVRTQQILDKGQIPIIDRCNISRSQRQYFTSFRVVEQQQQQQQQQQRQEVGSLLSTTMTNVVVDVIVLQQASVQECIVRCQNRHQHPTLAPSNAAAVIRKMTREYEVPDRQLENGLRTVTIIHTDAELQHTIQELLLL